MHINPRAIGIAALGIGTVATLAACGSANENKSPEAVAADTMAKFDSNLPFTKSYQLDVRGESSRPQFDFNGQLQGTYSAAALLSAADNHTFGTPTNADPTIDVKSNGKATFNEIVQVVRHYDADTSGLLDGAEAKQFDREMGVSFQRNPFYSYDIE